MRTLRSTFGSGVIDPRLAGRVDLQRYKAALLSGENFLPSSYGGLEFRKGLRHRFTLAGERHPERIKIVRAPGYSGKAERILVLDGSGTVGKIEAYQFPYAGNLGFRLTHQWNTSVNRPKLEATPSELIETPLFNDIHRARVSFGDFAGTMICHRDNPPLHITDPITASGFTQDHQLLLFDNFSDDLHSVDPDNPTNTGRYAGVQDSDGNTPYLGNINIRGVAASPTHIVALELLRTAEGVFANLWIIQEGVRKEWRLFQTVSNTLTRPFALVHHRTDWLLIDAEDNSLWKLDGKTAGRVGFTGVPIWCMASNGTQLYGIGDLSPDVGIVEQLLGLVRSRATLYQIDPDNAVATAIGRIIYTGNVEYDRLILQQIAFQDSRLFMVARNQETNTTVMFSLTYSGVPTASLTGELPQIAEPRGLCAYTSTSNVSTVSPGNLYDESAPRSLVKDRGINRLFTPKSYVDHLANIDGNDGNPACATVLNGRMIFAGSRYRPGSFLGSELYPRVDNDLDLTAEVFQSPEGIKAAAYRHYWLFYHPRRQFDDNDNIKGIVATAQDSFSYELAAERAVSIIWMVPFNGFLMFGTNRGIWLGTNLRPDQPPDGLDRRLTTIPVGDVDPLVTDLGVLYVDAQRRHVYAAAAGVGYEPPQRRKLTAAVGFLTDNSRIRQIAWQSMPQRRLWIVTEDGKLAALCYEPENDVFGWFPVVNPAIRVLSICVVPTEDDSEVLVAAVTLSSTPNVTSQVIVSYQETVVPQQSEQAQSAQAQSGDTGYLLVPIDVDGGGGALRAFAVPSEERTAGVDVLPVGLSNDTVGYGGAFTDGTTIWWIVLGQADAYDVATRRAEPSRSFFCILGGSDPLDSYTAGAVLDDVIYVVNNFRNRAEGRRGLDNPPNVSDSDLRIDLGSGSWQGAVAVSPYIWFVDDTLNYARAWKHGWSRTQTHDLAVNTNAVFIRWLTATNGPYNTVYFMETWEYSVTSSGTWARAYFHDDRSRQSSRDINLGSGIQEGCFARGSTVWFGAQRATNEDKIYRAYTIASHGGATRNISQDMNFGNIRGRDATTAAGNIWVINEVERRLDAYHSSTRQRTSSSDIDISETDALENGLQELVGLTANLETIWLIYGSRSIAYAWNAATRERDPAKDIELGAGNWSGGVWMDGDQWFIDYELTGGSEAYRFEQVAVQDTSRDISLGAGDWRGGASDGTRLWFIDDASNAARVWLLADDSRSVGDDVELGAGTWYGATYVDIDATVPIAPAAPEVDSIGGQATVTAPVTPGASTYNVRHREAGTTDAWTVQEGIADRDLTVLNLMISIAYEFQVQGENDAGPGAWSLSTSVTQVVSIIVPAKPGDLMLVAGRQQVVVTVPIVPLTTSYYLEYHDGSGNWLPFAGAGPSWTVDELQDDTEYTFQARALNDAGPGPWSDSASVTTLPALMPPAAPVLPLLSPGDSSVTVNIIPVVDAVSYQLQYRIVGEEAWMLATVEGPPWTVTLDNDRQYEFQVGAINAVGMGPWSESATATPTAPEIEPIIPALRHEVPPVGIPGVIYLTTLDAPNHLDLEVTGHLRHDKLLDDLASRTEGKRRVVRLGDNYGYFDYPLSDDEAELLRGNEIVALGYQFDGKARLTHFIALDDSGSAFGQARSYTEAVVGVYRSAGGAVRLVGERQQSAPTSMPEPDDPNQKSGSGYRVFTGQREMLLHRLGTDPTATVQIEQTEPKDLEITYVSVDVDAGD